MSFPFPAAYEDPMSSPADTHIVVSINSTLDDFLGVNLLKPDSGSFDPTRIFNLETCYGTSTWKFDRLRGECEFEHLICPNSDAEFGDLSLRHPWLHENIRGKKYNPPRLAKSALFQYKDYVGEVWVTKNTRYGQDGADLDVVYTDGQTGRTVRTQHPWCLSEQQYQEFLAGSVLHFHDIEWNYLLTTPSSDLKFFNRTRPSRQIPSVDALHVVEPANSSLDVSTSRAFFNGTHRWLQPSEAPSGGPQLQLPPISELIGGAHDNIYEPDGGSTVYGSVYGPAYGYGGNADGSANYGLGY